MRFKLLLFMIGATLRLAAQTGSVGDALQHDYLKHVMVLRTAFTTGDEQFDSSGQSLNPPSERPWLVFGGIYVEKISLSPDELKIQGPRIEFGGEDHKKPELYSLEKYVNIKVRLDKPLATMDEAKSVLNRIFIESAGVSLAQPRYRRADYNAPDADADLPKDVYKLGKGMTPPQGTYTPEPEYSDVARKKGVQGQAMVRVILNQKGEIVRIGLEKALGYGLDENAMDMVKTWRFKPATIDGKPIAVVMNIQIGFRLFSR